MDISLEKDNTFHIANAAVNKPYMEDYQNNGNQSNISSNELFSLSSKQSFTRFSLTDIIFFFNLN